MELKKQYEGVCGKVIPFLLDLGMYGSIKRPGKHSTIVVPSAYIY